MNKLQGGVAVITGGRSGMSLATAKRFVAEGTSLFINGLRRPELDVAVILPLSLLTQAVPWRCTPFPS